jgi:N-terminal half of MaoC dehydratase
LTTWRGSEYRRALAPGGSKASDVPGCGTVHEEGYEMALEAFPVEATHIMMFARAIGDPNPAYSDPDSEQAKQAGGIVAPPTFPMAGMQFEPANPFLPKPGEPWFGSGREATGTPPKEGDGSGVQGGLHAEQSFTYVKPLRPGMVLHAVRREGETWTKESRRGGTLTFSEMYTDYLDESDELIVTARMLSVIPSVNPTEGS